MQNVYSIGTWQFAFYLKEAPNKLHFSLKAKHQQLPLRSDLLLFIKKCMVDVMIYDFSKLLY